MSERVCVAAMSERERERELRSITEVFGILSSPQPSKLSIYVVFEHNFVKFILILYTTSALERKGAADRDQWLSLDPIGGVGRCILIYFYYTALAITRVLLSSITYRNCPVDRM